MLDRVLNFPSYFLLMISAFHARKWVLHLRKVASTNIMQFQHEEVVTRINDTRS